MSVPTTSDAQLHAEIERLKKSVEALEAVINTQGGQVTIGTSQRGITIKKNGDVSINANNFEAVARAGVSIKASGNVLIKGKKILDI